MTGQKLDAPGNPQSLCRIAEVLLDQIADVHVAPIDEDVVLPKIGEGGDFAEPLRNFGHDIYQKVVVVLVAEGDLFRKLLGPNSIE